MTCKKFLAATAACLVFSGVAQAALVDRGGGRIYDTTRNITWVADMTLAKTSGYDTDGFMSWEASNAWASSLDFGGYDDWRLPTISELSGLFITELGNQAGQSVLNSAGDTTTQIANRALFLNVQAENFWSATEFSASRAMYFNAAVGGSYDGAKFSTVLALAVRSGDVPEPQTLALVLMAMGATALGRKKRPA